MPVRILRPLPALLSCAALGAAELPVVAVTVAPQGALVTRRGALPAGDEVVAGLPAGLDRATLAVTVEGLGARPWSEVAAPAPAAAEDAAARAVLAAAEQALALARERAALARAVLDPPAAGAATAAPPTPAVQRGAAEFLRRNLEQALADEAAALARREQAQAALAAAPAAAPHLALRVPGAAGRTVTVDYRSPGAWWRPVYRCELDQGGAVLAVEAEIGTGEEWPALALTLANRAGDGPVLVPPPRIPLLGLPEAIHPLERPRGPAEPVVHPRGREEAVADSEMGGEGAFIAIGAGGGGSGMFGSRSGGSKKRALGRLGGSAEVQAAVAAGLARLKEQRAQDPGCEEPPRTTALAVLAFLGDGHDHKSPGRFRETVRGGIAALCALDPARLDAASLALATAALAEAAAMAPDAALQAAMPRLESAWAARLGDPAMAERLVAEDGPLAGVWLAHAASALVAGGRGGDLRDRLAGLPERIAAHGDRDAARVCALAARGLLRQGVALDPAEAERWGQLTAGWLAQGRGELAEWAGWAALCAGGPAFPAWQVGAVPVLSAAARSGQGGPAALSAAVRALEVFYRFKSDAGIVLQPPPPLAACPWPLRWTTPPVAPAPGRTTTVALRRIALSGARDLVALPAVDQRVWLRWDGANPTADALPAGPCRLVVDGRQAGTVPLPLTRPGGPLALALGPEPRARVVRTLAATSDDGVFRRTLDLTVRWRLEAWPGCPAVRVVEPLPLPGHPKVEIEHVQPALAGEELERLRRDDPFWRLSLSPAAPERTASWRAVYPAEVRPVLEVQP